MAYFGSKTASGLRQAIVAAMPPHDTYIETHLGSGAVMLAKPPAAASIGVDADQDALDLYWRTVNETTPHLAVPSLAQIPRLHLGDAVEFLQAFDFSIAGRVLIYADPPYVLATRSSAKRYRFDYEDADHVRLIEALRQVPAAVILSGYPSDLYARLLSDWRSIELQAMTRGGVRTEKLWFNFPAGQVQWAGFAGRDFTDRQRIKRKAQRWARMYAALDPGERLAVLSALLAVNGPAG